ncbi:MAG: PilZ domain-containing protein [Pseudomonadota bacterium]
MTNARKSERVTINKEFDTFDQFIEEYVTNISRSGAFVKTSTPLPVGTEVDLRFTVVIGGIETIEGIGQVVRVETDPAGMGVVFKSSAVTPRKLIEKLLTAKSGMSVKTSLWGDARAQSRLLVARGGAEGQCGAHAGWRRQREPTESYRGGPPTAAIRRSRSNSTSSAWRTREQKRLATPGRSSALRG